MTITDTARVTFGEEHFGEAYLGDVRRTRSLIDLADRFFKSPAGTLPHKCKCPNALRRCYDLMKADAVTHEAVLGCHVQRTLRLVQQQRGVVLYLHDGSELDYSGLTSLHGQLGQIGNSYGRGYECLNSLAVLPGGRTVLGLVSQILHVRPRVPKNETLVQRRQRQDRESLLWLKAVDAVAEATRLCRQKLGLAGPPEELLEVDVADRQSDTFEFLAHEDRLDRKYVLRSKHNREIRLGHGGVAPQPGAGGEEDETRLHDHLRTLAEQARRVIHLAERDGRPARKATVAMAWAAVTVLAPQNQRGLYHKRAFEVWAIRVWEVGNVPAGAEAVEWFLLTNLPVTTPAGAWQKVDWYCCRWVIEEFHKAQKTGCAIEDPQFTKAERLQPTIALLSVVAVGLLSLRDLSRDERLSELPAAEVVDEELVDVLSGWRYGEVRPLSVRAFFLALARLGGHQNRKGDGQPGWLVLWRGWADLQRMAAGARAARAPRRPPATPARDADPNSSPESG
jgi:Transposase DNA-binding